ncbi:MAG: glycosyl hydrolase 53 family protein [Chloroflexi bacterium]|nr:glycosyl hydrolase 53 family protein [Chloroflexota bacterium]
MKQNYRAEKRYWNNPPSWWGLLSLVLLMSCATPLTSTPTPAAAPSPPPLPTLSPSPPPTVLNPNFNTQPGFFFGVDLSYANEMEDCGATYRVNGEADDVFTLFAGQGTNLVRARLWHNPTWTAYSTLADVEKTFRRAQTAGMNTLLTIHYSDDWADPGQQRIPAAWQEITDTTELAQAVYDYTREVLLTLNEAGVLPGFVQVGNETNGGLLKNEVGLDWPRDAPLFNAGIRAIRDATNELGYGPQIVLHVAQPENTGWWFREAIANGVTDFDVIGLSYYPQWSRLTIAQTGGQINALRQAYGKEVMIVETGYPWTLDAAAESANNILGQGLSLYGISPQAQHDFLFDLTQTTINNGGLGIIYWEPAWVPTPCETRWGQGSHWENATFFDFHNNNELLPAAAFLHASYTYPTHQLTGQIEATYGSPLTSDATGDNLQQLPHLDLQNLYVSDDADYFYMALTLQGDITRQLEGSYLVYLDTTNDSQGADVDVHQRPIIVTAEHRPEFRLDIGMVEENGTVGTAVILYQWDGTTWEEVPFTGAIAFAGGNPSTLEWQLPKALWPDVHTLWIGVVSVGRGRNDTASDILGPEVSPLDWADPVTITTLSRYDAAAHGDVTR